MPWPPIAHPSTIVTHCGITAPLGSAVPSQVTPPIRDLFFLYPRCVLKRSLSSFPSSITNCVLHMAHDSTFREELAIAYPTYGTALWEPDPMGQYDAIEVGDVGFIRRGTGCFQRLFNVLHHKDHPSHRNTSLVPEDHEQLQPISGHILKGKIRTGSRKNSHHFCSKHVTLEFEGRGPAASR